MVGESHFRVRGVKCGKCERIHTWYKYRVWREGKKIKEEYIGKCDASGNDYNADAKRYWENVWKDYTKQWEQAYTYTRQQARTTPKPERKRTPYEILGVSYTATTEQITTAYRTLVKKYHPDLHPGIDQRLITEINVAYHILTR